LMPAVAWCRPKWAPVRSHGRRVDGLNIALKPAVFGRQFTFAEANARFAGVRTRAATRWGLAGPHLSFSSINPTGPPPVDVCASALGTSTGTFAFGGQIILARALQLALK
jgi:hypothetical protein